MFEIPEHFEEYVSRYILGHTFSLDISDDAGQIGKFLEMKINGGRLVDKNKDSYSRDLVFFKTCESAEIKTVTARDIHIAKRKKDGFGVLLDYESSQDFAYNKMKNCYFFPVIGKWKWDPPRERNPIKKIIEYVKMIKATNLDFYEFRRHLQVRFSESRELWETRINYDRLLSCYKSIKIFEGGVK